jgi:hypothetical protein
MMEFFKDEDGVKDACLYMALRDQPLRTLWLKKTLIQLYGGDNTANLSTVWINWEDEDESREDGF